MIMVMGITSGMLCLGESRLYTGAALGKIGLAILICMVGIWRLLQKSPALAKQVGKEKAA